MSGPSQPKVTDEDWSDERVKSFLALKPRDETHPDYFVVVRAYQSMVLEDFRRFVAFFSDAGRSINEPGPDGRTIFDVVSEHGRSQRYADCLKDVGATEAS